MRKKRLLSVVLLVLVVSTGCPQGASHQRPIDTPGAGETSAAEELKTYLTDVAEMGAEPPGMEASMLEEQEQVPANLKEDFEALKAALAGGSADEVKTKAKEMLGKL